MPTALIWRTLIGGNFDLVVIDESHNFRNDTKPKRDDAGNIIHHSRYTRLLEEVIKGGCPNKGADAFGDAGEYFAH